MNPSAVEVGPTGDVFVVDRGNHCVRRIDRDGRTVTTFAGSRRPIGANMQALTALQPQNSGGNGGGVGSKHNTAQKRRPETKLTPAIYRLEASVQRRGAPNCVVWRRILLCFGCWVADPIQGMS